MLRGLIESQDLVRFDRAHFKGIGASALDFEAVYWMLTPDFQLHMDRQQAIHLGLLRAFAREGIAFAAPPQALLVAQPAANPVHSKTSG
jgi:small-conductance mechanosensitive channel